MLIGAGEIIRRSYHLYRANFRMYFKYILLNFVPGILSLALFLIAIPMTFSVLFVDKTLAISLGMVIILFSIILSVVGLWLNFAFIKAISYGYTNTPAGTLLDNLKKSVRVLLKGIATTIMVNIYALWPMFATMLLYFIISTLLTKFGIQSFTTIIRVTFLLLFFYSFFHLIRYYTKLVFALFEAVIYSAPVKKSLAESQVLVVGRWWSILWRIVAPMFVFWIISVVASGILAQTGTQIGGIMDTILGILAVLVNILIAPLFATAMVILFHEAEHKV